MLTDIEIDQLEGKYLNNATRKYIADPDGRDNHFLSIAGFGVYDFCNDLQRAWEILESVRREPFVQTEITEMLPILSDELGKYLVSFVHKSINVNEPQKEHLVHSRGKTLTEAMLRAALKLKMRHLLFKESTSGSKTTE